MKYEVNKEKEMKELKHLINSWKDELFTDEGEIVWRTWVDLKTREHRDLKKMVVDSSIADEYRARAILILLTPEFKWNPFHWVEDYTSEHHNYHDLGYYHPSLDFSENLARFTLDLLSLFVPYVAARADYDKEADNLNRWVLELMVTLPESLQSRAYDLYEFKDRISRGSMGNLWGFYNAISHPRLSEHWKTRFDDIMRVDAVNDWLENAAVNHPYDTILFWYIYIANFSQELEYGLDLFATQWDFIVRMLKSPDSPHDLLDNLNIGKALKFLTGDKHLELLRNLIDLACRNEVAVFDDDTLERARVMLGLLESGSNSQVKITAAILHYTGECATNRLLRQQESEILRQMQK